MKSRIEKLLSVLLAIFLLTAFVPAGMGTAWAATVTVTTEAELSNAITSAGEGDVISIEDDITLSENLSIGNSVTLTSTEGSVLSSGAFKITIPAGEDVTFGGDLVVEGSGNSVVEVAGTFTLADNASLAQTSESSSVQAVLSYSGRINITGGSITSSYTGIDTGSTLNVSGGQICGSNYGIRVMGSTGRADISGGQIQGTGTNGTAVFVGTNGTANISGGTFTGGASSQYAVWTASTANITSGTFNGKVMTSSAGTINVNTTDAAISFEDGVSFLNEQGQVNYFLSAIPGPVTFEAGNPESMLLQGVDSGVAFSIDDETDEELGAAISNNTVTVEPTAAGDHVLALTAMAVENRTFNLTIAVTVTGGGGTPADVCEIGAIADAPAPLTIVTVAGNGADGYTGDGSTAAGAQMSRPYGVALDSEGNLYIADDFNHCIRMVPAHDYSSTPFGIAMDAGSIYTVAGIGQSGYSGDGGPAASAKLYYPRGVAVDSSGNLYIADMQNSCVRMVADSNQTRYGISMIKGNIYTVAGTGTGGYSGDGSQATQARINKPFGLGLDSSGNLYIADTYNHCIRRVDTSGIITTVAGTPELAGYGGDGGLASAANVRLQNPYAVTVDGSGSLYIADATNSRIRMVAGTNHTQYGITMIQGYIYTVAGNGTDGYSGDGGAATGARLSYPDSLRIDNGGNMYIAESYNNSIRKVDTGGIITTVSGQGPYLSGYSGDGSLASDARLNGPHGVTADSAGNLFIADSGNHVIRKIYAGQPGNASITGITVANQPAKLIYTAGETLDLSGLVVTLDYNDGSTLDVDYEDFNVMGITTNPENGTTLTVESHHGQPIEISCNAQTINTANLTVAGATIGAAVWNYRSPLPASNIMENAKYINGQYMAVGYNGTLITSADGVTWQKVEVGTDTDRLTGIAYGNNKYVIVGTACDYAARVYTSDDGLSWRETAAVPHHWLHDVVYGNGKFVAVGQSGKILISADGETWETKTVSSMDYTLLSVTYADGKYVAAGMGATTAKPKGGIMTSQDGENWTVTHSNQYNTLWDITYGEGIFVTVGGTSSGSYYICTSTDGAAWTQRSNFGSSYAQLLSVNYDGNKFIAVGHTNSGGSSGWNKAFVTTSGDGINWIDGGDITKTGLRAITGNTTGSQYVAMGGYGNIYTSDNGGTSWTSRTLGTTKTLRDVAWNGSDLFVSVGREGTIQTSTDGVIWTIQTSGTTEDLNKVDYLNSQFIAVGKNGTILTSANGTVWTSRDSGTTAELQDIAFGEGKYIAGGNGAAKISSDGFNWNAPVGLITLKTVAYGNGGFVALSQYGEAFNSADGVNWSNCGRLANYSSEYPMDMIYAGGKFVAVGGYGKIFLSSGNGTSWTTIESDLSNDYLRAITYGGGNFAAVAQGGKILASADGGTTWFMQPSDLTPNPYYSLDDDAELYGIVAGGDSFVAVGGHGAVLQSEDLGICTDPDAHDVAITRAKLDFYDISGPGANENAGRIVMNMNLITSGHKETNLSWTSSKPEYVTTNGTVIRPSFGSGDQVVYLTATITKGSASDTKTFNVVVTEQSDPDIGAVEAAVAALNFNVIKGSNTTENNIVSDLNLITEGDSGTAISWTSSKPEYIADSGSVTRPAQGESDQTVTLTAAVSKGAVSRTRTFYLTVKAQLDSDAQAVAEAKTALIFDVIKGNNIEANSIISDLNLVTDGGSGTTISWTSSKPAYIATDGKVIRPAQGAANESVTLTAAINKGEASATQTFSLTVRAKTVLDVTGIAMTVQPTNLTYTAGETLDLRGMTVTLSYNDESTLEVGYEDFSYMGITVDPAQGTSVSVPAHHGQPLTVKCNGQTAVTNNLTVTSSGGSSEDEDEDDGGGGGGSGAGNNPPVGYVPNRSIKTSTGQVTIDLAPNATRISPAQTNNLINANRERPVVIQGDNYSITFPEGTMQAVPGQREYDFGLRMNAGPNYGRISELADESLILMVSYNHSGPLPAEAVITFNVGASYAGQTLYFYYYNEADGQPEYLQSAVVGSDGTISVRQSHCSDYLFTKERLTGDKLTGQVIRIFGQDRYLTAIEISKAYFDKGAETVVMTRGDISVDALPAVPLAKQYNAPLLLTPPDSLPPEVLSAIKELGAKKVVIIGGPGAINPAVENTLKTNGLAAERIYGRTHYETAYAIARKLAGSSGQSVLVNGDKAATTFPDVLSVSSWAGYHGVPILYGDSTADRLPEATARALTELKITRTILVGGTAVIPARLEALIPDPVRYGGVDCYATNVEVLKALQPNPEKVYVATGRDFADALAGAAAASQSNSWLILTGEKGNNQNSSGLTTEQEQLLKSVKGIVKEVSVFGGSAVVPETTLKAVGTLLELER